MSPSDRGAYFYFSAGIRGDQGPDEHGPLVNSWLPTGAVAWQSWINLPATCGITRVGPGSCHDPTGNCRADHRSWGSISKPRRTPLQGLRKATPQLAAWHAADLWRR